MAFNTVYGWTSYTGFKMFITWTSFTGFKIILDAVGTILHRLT